MPQQDRAVVICFPSWMFAFCSTVCINPWLLWSEFLHDIISVDKMSVVKLRWSRLENYEVNSPENYVKENTVVHCLKILIEQITNHKKTGCFKIISSYFLIKIFTDSSMLYLIIGSYSYKFKKQQFCISLYTVRINKVWYKLISVFNLTMWENRVFEPNELASQSAG